IVQRPEIDVRVHDDPVVPAFGIGDVAVEAARYLVSDPTHRVPRDRRLGEMPGRFETPITFVFRRTRGGQIGQSWNHRRGPANRPARLRSDVSKVSPAETNGQGVAGSIGLTSTGAVATG